MNHTQKIFAMVLILFLLNGCSQEKEIELTAADFKSGLKKDMTYKQMTTRFGLPSSDIGSGIHIYVYPLHDTTSIWVGMTDHIFWAKHVDPSGVVIDTIIGP